MDTTKLEIGLIGDFLVGSMSAHPLPLKGERGEGLRPEHFSDPTSRAAYEEILKAGTFDSAALQARLLAKMGGEFCEKAVLNASTPRCRAIDRVSHLAAEGRKRLAIEELTKLFRIEENCEETFFFSEMAKIVRNHELNAAKAHGLLASESLAEFLALPPASLDPIVEGAFERGDKVELIAPSKCRKSFFALDLALHIAAGRPFAGLVITKKRRVLVVNLEIKRDWMKRRVLSRLEGYQIAISETEDNLVLMNCRGQGGAVREAILARVKELKPDFVILDPRYKLMRADEDENSGNGLIGILNLLDAIAEEGAAVMIVSHDKKGDTKALDIRDRGAGSNWAARDVDCRFVMTPDKKDDSIAEVGILARNYPPKKPLKLKATQGRFELIN